MVAAIPRAKDTFFKKVYESEERERDLASFLLGISPEKVRTANVSTVADFLQLEADRGIFVDLLTDKEVCDMAMAQFTRDDILIYQGLEKGREEGIVIGRKDEADRMTALNIALLSANRADDLLRASRDKLYRESLYKELGLSYPSAEEG